jgi:tripartite-type tricarboxylate transporter receptor subunit TctC
MTTRAALLALVLAGFGIDGICPAVAQSYPARPVTLLVPFAPGGPTDTIGRIMAERMRAPLGQPVVIENVTGAGGSVGVGRVVRATPDGYTVSVGNSSSHVFNGAIYALQYDLLNDLEPVALLSSQPLLIVAKKAMPANDLKELIAWLKANPDKATMGHPGSGSAAHVGGAFMQKETGTRFQFVPYRGGGPAMQDVISGQIDFTMTVASNSLPQIRSGLIKPYAVMGKIRLTAAPEIPTVDEAGVHGVYSSVWFALWAPKGTPKDIVGRLGAAVVEARADPAVQARLHDLGQEIPPRQQQTPEYLGALHKAEVEKWWPIVKAAGIKGE